MTTMVRRGMVAGVAVMLAGGTFVAIATGNASATVPGGTAKPAPTVQSVSPNTGDPSGRVHVLVTGSHFRHVRAVTVGGKSARFTVEGRRRMLVRVPQQRAGSYHVVVHTAAGASPADAASRYTYVGTPWVVDKTPPGTQHGVSLLLGAACSAVACYAVGSRADSANAPTSALVERHDAHGWTREPVHFDSTLDPTSSAELFSVQCPADGPCLATGYAKPAPPSTEDGDLVAVRDQGVWQARFLPLPDGVDQSELMGWSPYRCVQQTCIAVTAVRSGSSDPETDFVVRRYAEGAWTTQALGTIDTRLTFMKFDCPSTTLCLGFGTTGTQLVGVRISLGSSPHVGSAVLNWTFHNGGNEFGIFQISCASPAFCVASAGEYDRSEDPDGPLVLVDSLFVRYAGHRWVGHHFAAPLSMRSTDLRVMDFEVACASVSTCYMAGHSSAGNDVWATATKVTATAQTTKSTAVPDPYRHMYIDGPVKCDTESACMTLGSSPGSAYPGRPRQEPAQRFLVHLGSKDRPAMFRLPTYQNLAYYDGFDYACSAPNNCVIVGGVRLADKGGDGAIRTRSYVLSS